MWFCKVGRQRGSIRHICNYGWSNITKLYGLKASSINTIKVKHLLYQPGDKTSALSLNENFEVRNFSLSHQIPQIYLPGKKNLHYALFQCLYFNIL